MITLLYGWKCTYEREPKPIDALRLVCTLSVGVLLHATWCIMRSLGDELSPGDAPWIDEKPVTCTCWRTLQTLSMTLVPGKSNISSVSLRHCVILAMIKDRPAKEGRLKAVIPYPLMGGDSTNPFNVFYQSGDQRRQVANGGEWRMANGE